MLKLYTNYDGKLLCGISVESGSGAPLHLPHIALQQIISSVSQYTQTKPSLLGQARP